MKDKIRKITKSRIFNLVEILLFIAVCIGVGALAAFISHESDPTEQAVEYFRAFVQRDYDKMYDCIRVEDGCYVGKDMYQAAMQKKRESMNIDSYEIKKPEKADGKKQVVIVCTDSETQEAQEFVIRFTAVRKGISLIPDYYVDIDDMLLKDFSVTMKQGRFLELNGEKVPDSSAEITADDDGNTVYWIKGMIGGQYKVSATDTYSAIVQNINFSEEGTEINLTGSSYTANDKYTQLITEHSENVIEQFYSAVRKRKPSAGKLQACFQQDKALLKKVKEYVEESQEIVYWPEQKNIDNYQVIELKMSGLKNTITYNPDKKKYQVVYTYSYNYVSSTDTALYTSYVYKISGKCKSEMTLTYSLRDDAVVLTNMKVKNKNKKDGKAE